MNNQLISKITKQITRITHLNLFADSAFFSLISRVDIEFNGVLGDILEDFHQASENLWFKLTNETTGQKPRATARSRGLALVIDFWRVWSGMSG